MEATAANSAASASNMVAIAFNIAAIATSSAAITTGLKAEASLNFKIDNRKNTNASARRPIAFYINGSVNRTSLMVLSAPSYLYI